MAKSNEALWWSLFSAGGVLAALCMPALIVVTGFVLPASDPADTGQRFERLLGAVSSWPVRIILFVVIFLSFFHCAHRIRHTLMDLGLRRMDAMLMGLCYGGATLATLLTAFLIVKI